MRKEKAFLLRSTVRRRGNLGYLQETAFHTPHVRFTGAACTVSGPAAPVMGHAKRGERRSATLPSEFSLLPVLSHGEPPSDAWQATSRHQERRRGAMAGAAVPR
jgi:hypothetical protein